MDFKAILALIGPVSCATEVQPPTWGRRQTMSSQPPTRYPLAKPPPIPPHRKGRPLPEHSSAVEERPSLPVAPATEPHLAPRYALDVEDTDSSITAQDSSTYYSASAGESHATGEEGTETATDAATYGGSSSNQSSVERPSIPPPPPPPKYHHGRQRAASTASVLTANSSSTLSDEPVSVTPSIAAIIARFNEAPDDNPPSPRKKPPPPPVRPRKPRHLASGSTIENASVIANASTTTESSVSLSAQGTGSTASVSILPPPPPHSAPPPPVPGTSTTTPPQSPARSAPPPVPNAPPLVPPTPSTPPVPPKDEPGKLELPKLPGEMMKSGRPRSTSLRPELNLGDEFSARRATIAAALQSLSLGPAVSPAGTPGGPRTPSGAGTGAYFDGDEVGVRVESPSSAEGSALSPLAVPGMGRPGGHGHVRQLSGHMQTLLAPPTASPSMPASPTFSVEEGGFSVDEIQDPVRRADEKRKRKRRNVIMELVETEESFCRDLMVVDEYYRQRTAYCPQLSIEDAHLFFGQVPQLIDFAQDFMEIMRSAAEPVFEMKLTETVDEDTVEEHKSWVGNAFIEMIGNMEIVYTDYCANHDAVATRLVKLEQDPAVKKWLDECTALSKNHTNAWDLGSLLIKPVQRVLKYPLLLHQILESTPTTHEDFPALKQAVNDVMAMAERINDVKRRKDLVHRIVGKGKACTLKQSIGISEPIGQQELYHALHEKFRRQESQIQQLAKDVDRWLCEMKVHLGVFLRWAYAMREWVECVPLVGGMSKIAGARWRMFELVVAQMEGRAFDELEHVVRKTVVEPLESVGGMYANPAKFVLKREKKALDFARVKALRVRGDMPDPHLAKSSETFVLLDKTLQHELPKFLELSRSAVDVCLQAFAAAQKDWYASWKDKLIGLLPEYGNEDRFQFIDIVGDYLVRQMVVDADMKAFSIFQESKEPKEQRTPELLPTIPTLPSSPTLPEIPTFSELALPDDVWSGPSESTISAPETPYLEFSDYPNISDPDIPRRRASLSRPGAGYQRPHSYMDTERESSNSFIAHPKPSTRSISASHLDVPGRHASSRSAPARTSALTSHTTYPSLQAEFDDDSSSIVSGATLRQRHAPAALPGRAQCRALRPYRAEGRREHGIPFLSFDEDELFEVHRKLNEEVWMARKLAGDGEIGLIDTLHVMESESRIRIISGQESLVTSGSAYLSLPRLSDAPHRLTRTDPTRTAIAPTDDIKGDISMHHVGLTPLLLASAATMGFLSLTTVALTLLSATHLFAPATAIADGNCTRSVDFDPREATIDDVHRAIELKGVTCREIVQSYIDRIQAYDDQGPALNAVWTVNPYALDYADEMDEAIMQRNGFMLGPLYCVPVLLKDNYDTFDMHTTASSLALRDAQPAEDAPSVARLRAAGAIILGKTNLQEYAAASGVSNSSLAGQVKNPYDLTRTPGGSSGGTGAAVAASFSVFGTGTDTVNSIRSPASANSLVGYRPSRGLSTRAGIVPVSTTQDAIGPIARTVRDAAIAGAVMNGYDPLDNVTALGYGHFESDYVKYLSLLPALSSLRIGVVDGLLSRASDNETMPVNVIMNATIAQFEAAGAEIVHIQDPVFNITTLASNYDVQIYEYAALMDEYLSRPNYTARYHSFEALYQSGEWDQVVLGSFFGQAATNNMSTPAYVQKLAAIEQLKIRVATYFADQNLDVMIYPQQQRLVVPIANNNGQTGRNGLLAALIGAPVIDIPMGFSNATESAPRGIPVGLEVMGTQFADGKVFGIAGALEGVLRARKAPLSTWEMV
ncbi:hypothetical protein G7K_1264-t2 [Saitoella complicata NRRL Y-17804]|uniref:Dynamin-binding protein n=1 Tax=Saitoella complicata (strain BCRC 22490 / CBS 7301 / JCM 7358 / NBRC 10748 / NRRL Y-17804) TaxID=698492 RepID=A0A0E9NBI1_SAICN|nr:hypothetical protein G7K_1264-t2 [Saitoella complicata NRRL Y-17804]